MAEYNFDHGRRVQKTVASLNKDLNTAYEEDDDETNTDSIQYPIPIAPPSPKKQQPNNNQVMYQVMPTPNANTYIRRDDIRESKQNEWFKSTDLNQAQQQQQQNDIKPATPNRRALFGDLNRQKTAQIQQQQQQSNDDVVNVKQSTTYPLLERIPIIAQQRYNNTIKDLRNKINSLQNLSLKLHGGANERLFDNLQKKVVKLSQSSRIHQHELDGMRSEIEYLLNEIITQQNMREELYAKIDGMEEDKRDYLGQILAANSTIHIQKSLIEDWKLQNDDKAQMIAQSNKKLDLLNKKFEYQKEEIEHGKKMTEKNLSRLQAHIYKVSNNLSAERELCDKVQSQLQSAKLQIAQLNDDTEKCYQRIKSLNQEIAFYKPFEPKCEEQKEQISGLQRVIGSTKEQLNETLESLNMERQKSMDLNAEISEYEKLVNRLEDAESLSNAKIECLNKDLDARTMELCKMREQNENEIRQKEEMEAQYENERMLKRNLENDYVSMKESFKEKMKMLQINLDSGLEIIKDLQDQNNALKIKHNDALDNKQKEYESKMNAKKIEYISQCNDYELRLMNKTKDNVDLQNRMDELKKEHESLSKIWDNDQKTIIAINEQLASSRNQIKVLMHDSDKKLSAINDLKMELKESRSQCMTMNQMMEDKNMMIKNREIECNELKTRRNELLDLLDAKDSKINDDELRIKSLNEVADKYKALVSDHRQLETQKGRLSNALNTEKKLTKKLVEKLKKSSNAFSEMLNKDQEELSTLNKLLQNQQKEIYKKQKKVDKLSIILEDIKKNFDEERNLMEDTIGRLRIDYNNLAKTSSASKMMWDKKIKGLEEKVNEQERMIENKDQEMMRMSIDFAKIKSEVAMTAKYTDLAARKGKNDGGNEFYGGRSNKYKDEIENLYSLLGEKKSSLSPKGKPQLSGHYNFIEESQWADQLKDTMFDVGTVKSLYRRQTDPRVDARRDYLIFTHREAKSKEYGWCIIAISRNNYDEDYPTKLRHITIHAGSTILNEDIRSADVYAFWLPFDPADKPHAQQQTPTIRKEPINTPLSKGVRESKTLIGSDKHARLSIVSEIHSTKSSASQDDFKQCPRNDPVKQLSHATRINELEKELKEKNHALKVLQTVKIICIVIIVLLAMFWIPIAILWWRRSRETKIQRAHQLRLQSSIRIKKPVPQLSVINRAVGESKIEEMDTNVGRWQPERFSDLLDNSKIVQDVMMDDIVSQMKTEGLESCDV